MLLNLLDNGLKSGGTQVTVTGSHQKQGYVIAVADNGRGIPAGELKRITEAFYMVDKSRSRKEHGAGLGLALCQRIATIHGATLTFESQEGVGTTVTVWLPLDEEGET
jgi:signal transduction histidine kinase